MLVLTGPAGSGKTHSILRELAADARLLVPSATMADHIRNELARSGALVRPRTVDTLARFVNEWTTGSREPPAGAIELAVERALAEDPPAELARVAQTRGLRLSLASLIEELASAGLGTNRLGDLVPAALRSVYARVEREFSARGWVFGGERLACAAARIRQEGTGPLRRILFDGFFAFGAPELELIDALRAHAELTITLPDWEGARPTLERLSAMGCEIRRLGGTRRPAPVKILVKAPTLEQEADEVARRIAAHAAAGRAFREIGVVLRSRDPYVPVLEATLERFGIPARFHFSEPLARHGVVRFLFGAVEAMLGGWEHEATLEVVRSPFSGVGGTEADQFDFLVRERLPGRGLAALQELRADCGFLARLAELPAWAQGDALPQTWAAKARTLPDLFQAPKMEDRVTHRTAALWRGQAAALEAFRDAVDDAALALPQDEPLAFAAFWDACKIVFENTQLRVPDRRRDVVHVMDVHEARQWELPIVFVCGLLERQFPLYHGGNPILSDSARAALGLHTAEDRQREEELLFEVAVTRAGAELVLSYPEYNVRGDPNLPSFFLAGYGAAEQRARPAVPAGPPAQPVCRLAPIRDRALLDAIQGRYQKLRATAVETFLSCPFRFFIEQTLGLKPAPSRPGERLNPLVLGTIIHRVLSEMEHSPEDPQALLNRVFDEALDRERVPRGCRSELARIRMAADLRLYLGQAKLLAGWRVETEKTIRFPLGEIEITGRIDRCHFNRDGLAVVFDFKYSGAQGIRDRIDGYDENRFVQAALYLIGLRQMHGCTPGGMFYCGLKREVTIDGWHLNLPGFERIGESCTPDVLNERLERARTVTLGAAEAIRNGEVEAPSGAGANCRYCDSSDICRLTRETARVAAAGRTE